MDLSTMSRIKRQPPMLSNVMEGAQHANVMQTNMENSQNLRGVHHRDSENDGLPSKFVFQPPLPPGLNMHQAAFLHETAQGVLYQLGAYSIFLTLLASITFVAFLQPPGSFDANGFVRPSNFVTSFLFFSGLSFMLACTGLLSVAPAVHPLKMQILKGPLSDPPLPPPLGGSNRSNDVVVQDAQPKPIDVGPKVLTFEHERKIAMRMANGLARVQNYAAMSLLACVIAAISAGLAITESSSVSRYTLVATISFGSLILIIEVSLKAYDLFWIANHMESQ